MIEQAFKKHAIQVVADVRRTEVLGLSAEEVRAWIEYLQGTCADPAIAEFFIEVFEGNAKLVNAICQPGMSIERLMGMFMLRVRE